MKRLRATTTMPRRKPQFKHNKDTGAYVLKEGKEGIN
jgi:hypothetical protein